MGKAIIPPIISLYVVIIVDGANICFQATIPTFRAYHDRRAYRVFTLTEHQAVKLAAHREGLAICIS